MPEHPGKMMCSGAPGVGGRWVAHPLEDGHLEDEFVQSPLRIRSLGWLETGPFLKNMAEILEFIWFFSLGGCWILVLTNHVSVLGGPSSKHFRGFEDFWNFHPGPWEK